MTRTGGASRRFRAVSVRNPRLPAHAMHTKSWVLQKPGRRLGGQLSLCVIRYACSLFRRQLCRHQRGRSPRNAGMQRYMLVFGMSDVPFLPLTFLFQQASGRDVHTASRPRGSFRRAVPRGLVPQWEGTLAGGGLCFICLHAYLRCLACMQDFVGVDNNHAYNLCASTAAGSRHLHSIPAP